MNFDYFVAELRCPVCNEVAAADSGTNMQTYIRDDADSAYLGVGHPLAIDPKQMRDKNYWTIREPAPGEPIRLLESWTCPHCGRTDNWAEVTVRDGVIAGIQAVQLDRATLGRANYISDSGIYAAAELTRTHPSQLLGQNPVPILLEKL